MLMKKQANWRFCSGWKNTETRKLHLFTQNIAIFTRRIIVIVFKCHNVSKKKSLQIKSNLFAQKSLASFYM